MQRSERLWLFLEVSTADRQKCLWRRAGALRFQVFDDDVFRIVSADIGIGTDFHNGPARTRISTMPEGLAPFPEANFPGGDHPARTLRLLPSSRVSSLASRTTSV